ILGKVFRLLDLDPDSVYSEAHAAAAGGAAAAVERITVDPGEAPMAKENQGALDRSLIEARVEETARVSSMLAGIFDSEEDTEAGTDTRSPHQESEGSNGLDSDQMVFARELAAQTSWARVEVEELAAERDLLVDGALEVINNAAFEHCDAPFSEGDDPIEINREVAKEMLS
ncbi:MAG TPA: tellurite resistance TerB C-terminal domain-containing protein, partial [Solirubrobacterales bacterium]